MALRIKLDVDLKELKNFGFLEAEQYYYPKEDCVVELRISKTDRRLYIIAYDLEYDVIIEDIDLLFDLIKTSLVEKV